MVGNRQDFDPCHIGADYIDRLWCALCSNFRSGFLGKEYSAAVGHCSILCHADSFGLDLEEPANASGQWLLCLCFSQFWPASHRLVYAISNGVAHFDCVVAMGPLCDIDPHDCHAIA